MDERKWKPTYRFGDLIECEDEDGNFEHWAVYIGEGKIAQLNGCNNHKGKRRFKCKDVKADVVGLDDLKRQYSTVRINNQWDERYQDRIGDDKDIDDRIKKELRKTHDYHILFNNCEHFATRCRYGIGVSNQANRFFRKLFLLFILLLLFVCVIIKVMKRNGNGRNQK